MNNEKFYIVNQANQFGCVKSGDNGDELFFTPYIAHTFKSDVELDSITNISDYIIKGGIQKRYKACLPNHEYVYEELDLYIVMAFSEDREESLDTRYYYKNFDSHNYDNYDSRGEYYVNNISDIDFSKCTCVLDNIEKVKKNIGFSLKSKILKYTKREGIMCWVSEETGLPIKYDIIIDLFDIIGSHLIDSKTYDGKLFGLLNKTLSNVIDKKNI